MNVGEAIGIGGQVGGAMVWVCRIVSGAGVDDVSDGLCEYGVLLLVDLYLGKHAALFGDRARVGVRGRKAVDGVVAAALLPRIWPHPF